MKIEVPSYLTERFVPNIEAARLFEYFLISAVSSLLAIRGYLVLTGFPQIGGGGLHIAHMLWGGLFMLVAIGLLLSFVNSESRIFAAVLGGIGFGTFIDELGKFITSDNNYFYHPTVALIYVIFIVIYLVLRSLSDVTTYSSKTYLINAIEGIKELMIDDLNFDEKEKALGYLEKADGRDPWVVKLKSILKNAEPKKRKFSLYYLIKSRFLRWYSRAINVKLLARFFVGFFVIVSILSLVFAVAALMFVGEFNFSVFDYGHISSTILSGALTLVGVYKYMRRKLLAAYQYFLKATLVSIFLSQFFLFLNDEFMALNNLAFFIVVYSILNITINAEEQRVRGVKSVKVG